jgi:hypothetical protein
MAGAGSIVETILPTGLAVPGETFGFAVAGAIF